MEVKLVASAEKEGKGEDGFGKHAREVLFDITLVTLHQCLN